MAEPQKKILVLTLGGTIDAQAYPESEGDYPAQAIASGHNAAFEALKSLCHADTQLTQIKICDKDSKSLNEHDIATLYHHISAASGFERIIVTMGTDKMRDVALNIKQRILAPLCPVIFTGAIWPISNGVNKTDAFDNLKLALDQSVALNREIYIAMSGYCAPPETLIKDFTSKRFVLYTKENAF